MRALFCLFIRHAVNAQLHRFTGLHIRTITITSPLHGDISKDRQTDRRALRDQHNVVRNPKRRAQFDMITLQAVYAYVLRVLLLIDSSLSAYFHSSLTYRPYTLLMCVCEKHLVCHSVESKHR